MNKRMTYSLVFLAASCFFGTVGNNFSACFICLAVSILLINDEGGNTHA